MAAAERALRIKSDEGFKDVPYDIALKFLNLGERMPHEFADRGDLVDSRELQELSASFKSVIKDIPHPTIPYEMTLEQMPKGSRGWTLNWATHNGAPPLNLFDRARVRLNGNYELGERGPNTVQVARHEDGSYSVDLSAIPGFEVKGSIEKYSPSRYGTRSSVPVARVIRGLDNRARLSAE